MPALHILTSKEGRYHTAVTQWMHQSNWKSSSFVQKMELTNVNKTFSSLSLTLNSKGADYMNWLIKNRCFKGWQDISLWACRHYLSSSKKNKSPKKDTTVYLSSFMFCPVFVPFNLMESV